MMHRCGLSQREAADYLDVNHRTVGYWLSGRMAPRPEHWQRLADLCEQQHQAAVEALRRALVARGHLIAGDILVPHLSRTDEEAQELGWPCAGAHLAVIRRIVEGAPATVTVIPVYDGDDAGLEPMTVAALPAALLPAL